MQPENTISKFDPLEKQVAKLILQQQTILLKLDKLDEKMTNTQIGLSVLRKDYIEHCQIGDYCPHTMR